MSTAASTADGEAGVTWADRAVLCTRRRSGNVWSESDTVSPGCSRYSCSGEDSSRKRTPDLSSVSLSAVADTDVGVYLWCHVAQVEGVLHGLLTPFVIGCSSQVTSVKTTPLVVGTGCSMKYVHTGVCVCVCVLP